MAYNYFQPYYPTYYPQFYQPFYQPVYQPQAVVANNAPVSASEPISEPKDDSAIKDTFESINAKISQIESDIESIKKDIDLLKDAPKKINTTTKKRDMGDD